MTVRTKEEIASLILKIKKELAILKEREAKGKAMLETEEKGLLELLSGTGQTIVCDNYEFTCSSPMGSVEITAEVPKDYCTVKEVYNPDKKRIKNELKNGKNLNFAKIVYNEKLNIKEVKND